MKKLMIAAAATAMIGGAYATDCIGCGANIVKFAPPDSPYYLTSEDISCVAGHVWDITIKAKTMTPKCIPCKSDCEDGKCSLGETARYYDNASRTFTGVAWTCYCPCVTDDEAGDDYQEKENLLFWDAKNKVGFGYITWYYDPLTEEEIKDVCPECKAGTKAYRGTWGIDTTVSATDYFEEAFRFGKKATKAAWGFEYSGTGNNLKETVRDQVLTVEAIGLGTIKQYKETKKNLGYIVINKITGACIGSVTPCACPEDDEDGEVYSGKVIPVCFDFTDCDWCDVEDVLTDVPFYGTFTAKYNAKKSATLRTTVSYLQKIIPAYCQKIVYTDAQ